MQFQYFSANRICAFRKKIFWSKCLEGFYKTTSCQFSPIHLIRTQKIYSSIFCVVQIYGLLNVYPNLGSVLLTCYDKNTISILLCFVTAQLCLLYCIFEFDKQFHAFVGLWCPRVYGINKQNLVTFYLLSKGEQKLGYVYNIWWYQFSNAIKACFVFIVNIPT